MEDAGLRALPVSKKWWMLCNENQGVAATFTSNADRTKSSSSHHHHSNTHHGNNPTEDKSAPSYYIQSFSSHKKQHPPIRTLSDLAVRLRTMPLR